MAGFDNLLSYFLQVAMLAAAGLLLPRLLRLRSPRTVHGYLQSVLVLCLLLPLVQPWKEVAQTAAGVSFRTVIQGRASAAPVPHVDWTVVALAVLAVGVILRFCWLAVGLWRLRSYRRRAHPIEELPQGVTGLQADLKVSPQFFVSDDISGPVTFGLFRPVVLVPKAFLTMDTESRNALACHELWHVRRRDWAHTVAEEVVRSLFWFHPPLAWLIDRIRVTREQIVDGLVAGRTGSRRLYVQALLSMASLPVRADLLAPSFVRKHHLKERVALLLKESSMSKRRLTITLAAAGLGTVIAVILAVWYFPLLRPAAPQEPAHSANQDVAAPNASTPQERVYRVSEGASAPKLLHKIEPTYTQDARNRKMQGTVVLRIEVSPKGEAENIQVLRSLDPGLDANAIAALKQWKFQAGTKDNKPVRVAATVEINFRIS
ncbi:MAG: M56 family metallopeptidase [Bryobacteraceae bacterium]